MPMLKIVVIGLCVGMFVFSAWVYVETHDWVAVIFMVVSLTYGALFNSGRLDSLFEKGSSKD